MQRPMTVAERASATPCVNCTGSGRPVSGEIWENTFSNPTTVLQLLSMAGGVNDFAKAKNIMVMRNENGQQKAYKFNYKDVVKGQNLKQNILLQPGDTVVVP